MLNARYDSVCSWIKEHKKSITDFDFKPGSLVLVRNSRVELELNRKTKVRYFGPLVIIRRTPKGAYVLFELDGSVSKNLFAAFWLLSYYPRSRASVPIYKIVAPAETKVDRDVEETLTDDDNLSDAEDRPDAGT